MLFSGFLWKVLSASTQYLTFRTLFINRKRCRLQSGICSSQHDGHLTSYIYIEHDTDYRPSPVCLSEGTECESEGLATLLPKLKLEAVSGR